MNVHRDHYSLFFPDPFMNEMHRLCYSRVGVGRRGWGGGRHIETCQFLIVKVRIEITLISYEGVSLC